MDFPDKIVTYERFLDDLATRVAEKMEQYGNKPKFISQRKAYKMFGRANIDRWRRTGQIQPCKRPGVLEYNTEELRKLQQTVQDYFI